jgi:hypothetical protein
MISRTVRLAALLLVVSGCKQAKPSWRTPSCITASRLDLLSFFRMFDKPRGTFNIVTP